MKVDAHLSKLEKDFNEFKLQYNKQNIEDILIQRAVKTTIQILYDKGLFDKFQNTDKVLEDFLFTTRRRGDLSEEKTYLLLKHMDTYTYMGIDTYNYMSNTYNYMYIYTCNYISV